MTPTTEQIAMMAKLVPEQIRYTEYDGRHCIVSEQRSYRYWQPWLQTEAGRSDALVLLAAVCRWADDNWFVGTGLSTEVEGKWRGAQTALASGDLAAIQHATCEAAEAIGRMMP